MVKVPSDMRLAEATYCAALTKGLAKMGLHVESEVIEALGRHYTLMCRWGKRINLTSVTDPVEAAHLHGLDCLLFAELFAFECEDEVSDIGSGPGFPGLVLALARPRLKVCLVEPLRKRTSFLKVALTALSRLDVQIREAKLVKCSSTTWLSDVIVSRATIAPLDLVQLVPPYLRPGGRLITTSGEAAIELSILNEAAKDNGFQSLNRHEWKLPGGQTRILDEFTLAG